MKIVINACFGGFSVSLEAARHMASRGCEIAKREVEEFDEKTADPTKQNDFEQRFGLRWYGYGDYGRDSEQLVSAVEELGSLASGEMANLRVVEIPDGVEWEIEEYDGNEHVAESHRTWN